MFTPTLKNHIFFEFEVGQKFQKLHNVEDAKTSRRDDRILSKDMTHLLGVKTPKHGVSMRARFRERETNLHNVFVSINTLGRTDVVQNSVKYYLTVLHNQKCSYT